MHKSFTDNLICFTDRLIDSQHLINRLILMCLFTETVSVNRHIRISLPVSVKQVSFIYISYIIF